MPRVSVIIPSFNCAPWLAQAIESVLAQTYRDYEIVVVNDGSTDHTNEVVAPYLDRIIYVQQENQGLSAARNAGIRAAGGEFIALLDADDWWLPAKLERQVPRFDDPEVALVYSDFRIAYADGGEMSSGLSRRPWAAEGYAFENVLRSVFVFPTTAVLRRSSLDEVGYFDETLRSSEDQDLWLRLAFRWKLALVREPLAVYRRRGGNITSDSGRVSGNAVAMWEKASRTFDLSPAHRRLLAKQLGHAYYLRGYHLLSSGRMGEARRHLGYSLRHNPRAWRAWGCLMVSGVPFTLLDWARRHRPKGMDRDRGPIAG